MTTHCDRPTFSNFVGAYGTFHTVPRSCGSGIAPEELYRRSGTSGTSQIGHVGFSLTALCKRLPNKFLTTEEGNSVRRNYLIILGIICFSTNRYYGIYCIVLEK